MPEIFIPLAKPNYLILNAVYFMAEIFIPLAKPNCLIPNAVYILWLKYLFHWPSLTPYFCKFMFFPQYVYSPFQDDFLQPPPHSNGQLSPSDEETEVSPHSFAPLQCYLLGS